MCARGLRRKAPFRLANRLRYFGFLEGAPHFDADFLKRCQHDRGAGQLMISIAIANGHSGY